MVGFTVVVVGFVEFCFFGVCFSMLASVLTALKKYSFKNGLLKQIVDWLP